MSTGAVLSIDKLRVGVHAGGAVLLDGLTVTLAAGERLTVVGESGAGKSILAQAIMGTLPAGLRAGGGLQVCGHKTRGERARTQPLWGRQLMMLPQEPWLSLDPLMRVLPQVAEAAHYRADAPMPWPEARVMALCRLQRLNVVHAARHWVHQLSGGMAQRVALAAAQLGGAQLLIADEPTKGLETGMRDQVAQLLMAQQSDQRALLTITHDLELAAQLGGMLAVLRDGQLVEYGATQHILRAPQHAYTRALLDAQPKHWPVMLPRQLASGAPVLEGRSLSKAYGANRVFDSLDITLHAGEVVAVAGPSGCGKTTLGDVLLGLVTADAGHILRPGAATPRRFQKLYQDPPAAFAPHTRMHTALQDLVARHGLDALAVPPLMQKLNLTPGMLLRKPAELSGGELQRFALLRLLLLKPAFIFADEPTSRLDSITQRETMQLLCNAAVDFNCAVLLVTHDAHVATKAAHSQLHLPGSKPPIPQEYKTP